MRITTCHQEETFSQTKDRMDSDPHTINLIILWHLLLLWFHIQTVSDQRHLDLFPLLLLQVGQPQRPVVVHRQPLQPRQRQ